MNETTADVGPWLTRVVERDRAAVVRSDAMAKAAGPADARAITVVRSHNQRPRDGARQKSASDYEPSGTRPSCRSTRSRSQYPRRSSILPSRAIPTNVAGTLTALWVGGIVSAPPKAPACVPV